MATSAAAFPFEPEFREALTALQKGDLARAKRIYGAILSQDSSNPAAHVNLAAMTLDEGRMAEVVEHCSAVLQKDPDHPVAREVLAEANLRMANQATKQSDFAQAAMAVDDAVALAPESKDVISRAAAILKRFADDLARGGAAQEAERYRARSAALMRG